MPGPPLPPDPLPPPTPGPATPPTHPPSPPPVKEPEPAPPPVKTPDPAPPQEEPPLEVPPMEPPPLPAEEPPLREPPTHTPPIEDPPMPGVTAGAALALGALCFVLQACPTASPASPAELVTPPPATTSAATKPTSTLPEAPGTTAPPPPPPDVKVLPQLAKLRVPAGFTIELYAHNVENARSLTSSPSGTVFVGTRENDKVYALVDADKDGRAEAPIVVAEGLDTPNGVAFKAGSLYVAEVGRILRFDDVEKRLGAPQTPVVVTEALPKDKHHGWKFIAIGPDDKLYVPIGAPCNVCDEEDLRYASIARMNLDGSGFEVVARGVRNTVGFDWQPGTNTLFFTENGRDMLGDDLPADELNRVPPVLASTVTTGVLPPHFGFPYCHAGTIKDPEHGDKRACKDTIPPVTLLGAHVAALGMRFYEGAMFPADYKGQAFIAEHGSWNRSTKSGYRVVTAKLAADGLSATSAVFVDGWLEGDNAWGRPVDVLELADGSLLISDDKANAVYRVRAAT